jgi:hypothetical protein
VTMCLISEHLSFCKNTAHFLIIFFDTNEDSEIVLHCVISLEKIAELAI